jgi:FkbM family methyltransferase
LDIGAHHPDSLSNTAMFHYLGSRGINIEPDPDLFRRFKEMRPDDVNLNIGIGETSGSFDFFRMEHAGLNTFSQEEAERMSKEEGVKIHERVKLQVRTIKDVLNEHKFIPDFLSIDVEGYDLAILRSYDFEKHRPKVICAETIEYSKSLAAKKRMDLISFIESQGYCAFVDTHINTLFYDTRLVPTQVLRGRIFRAPDYLPTES